MAPVQQEPSELAVRAPQPSKSFDLKSSSDPNLHNGDPAGVTGREGELWVINNDTDRRFRYERSDGSSGTVIGLPDSSNGNATGAWSNGPGLWVADWDDTKLYAYNVLAGGDLSDRSSTFDIDLAGSNDGPRGVSGHGGTVWVVDKDDTYVYAYDIAARQRDADKDFNLKGGNSDPWGIWTDGSVAWVNDRDDNIIRAYDLTASGEPLLTDRSIDLKPENADPRGMWSDGATMWVADGDDTYVYAYDLRDSRKRSRDIDLTGSNDHPVRIVGDGETIWVADSDDTYVYAYFLASGNRRSGREFNMTQSGHDRADGMWIEGDSIWVLDTSGSTLYTYDRTSGAATTHGFPIGLNVTMKGLEGDSTRVLVFLSTFSAFYAYTYDGVRDSSRDLRLSKRFNEVAGVWSDGEVFWVLERATTNNPAGVYAHRWSNGNRVPAMDLTLSPQNADPRGIYGDGDTIWVGDGDDTKLYAYHKPAYTDPSFPQGDATIRTVDENVPQNAAVGARVSADDPDGDPLTYSLGGPDAGAFTIGSGNGQIRVGQGTSLDFEDRDSYEVIVRVTDGTNSGRQEDDTIDDTITVTINVNDVDEAGEVLLSTGEPQSGVAVGASLTDPDGSVSNVSWQWSRRRGTSGAFSDIAGAGASSYTPGDGDEGYFLRATARYEDGEGPNKTARATTTAAVVIPNDDPTFDAGATTARSIDENATAGTAVGAPVNATDADGDELAYSLTGDDASAFTVEAATGQIRVAAGTTLDFESRATYSVTARVSDGKNEISQADDVIDDTIDVTINIGNLDEPGAVTLSTGAPQQGVAMTATLSDPDGSLTGRTWQWWRGASSTGPWNSVGGETGSGYTPAAADVDDYLRVTVSYGDGEGGGKTAEAVSQQTVVGPTIVNGPPTFDEGTAAGRSVDENAPAGTDVGARVTATDPDGDSLTYSLDDSALFTVAGSTGRIRVAPGANLNFESESSHSLTLRVTDNKSPTGDPSSATDDIITVTVTVNNLDERGSVSFSTGAPEVDSEVTASLSDPDGVTSGVTWQWSRRRGTSGAFSDIPGATAPSYTPASSDLEYFLRATAGYDDQQGSGKSTNGIVTQAVAPDPAARDPAAPDPLAREPTVPRENERGQIAVRVSPAPSADTGDTDNRAILAAQFLATAVPTENAPEGCVAVAGYSTADGNRTPGTADDIALIELDVIAIVGASGEACRYDVTLELPPGFTTSSGAGTTEGVQPGTTVDVRVAIAGRNVLLVQDVVGDPGDGTARYESSTNCGTAPLPQALPPLPSRGGISAGERFVEVELRQGRYSISPAIHPDPESPGAWAGVSVPALNDEGEPCEATVAISDLPARCVAERAAVHAALPAAPPVTILEFRLMCGDALETERAAAIGDDDRLDSPVRVTVITPTIAGTYKVAWATWDGCDPGARTSGMSGSVKLIVAASAGPVAPQLPGRHTGSAESAAVMISPGCAYTWRASAVEASTGARCMVGPAPLVPDGENRIELTLDDPVASCAGRSTINVRVHPAPGTSRSAVLAARFSAIAVPAMGAPASCSHAYAESVVNGGGTAQETAEDILLIRLPVRDRTAGREDCRYDVTVRPPRRFWTMPVGARAEEVEPGTSVDFLTGTGGPARTVLLVQDVTGDPDGASARFTLYSDCLPSVLVPTPPGGGIRPTRLVELREGRYNLSTAFAAGPGSVDLSGGAPALVVSDQTGACEATLSVSHLRRGCSADPTTATAKLLPTVRRATLELAITCRRDTGHS